MNAFWSFLYARLQSVPSPVFTLRELQAFDAGLSGTLMRECILCRSSDPTEVCYQGAWVQVRRVGDQIYGVDTSDDPPSVLQLEEADVTHYTLSTDALIKHIRRENQLAGAASQLTHGIARIGRRSLEGRAVDIFLCLGPADSPRRTEERVSLLARSLGPKLVLFLLIPDIDHLGAFSADGIYFADLSPDFRINWPEELADPATEAREQYAFCLEGATWRITYLGHSFTVTDSVGARYVAHLLKHPGEVFNPTQLKNLTPPRQLQNTDPAPEAQVSTIADRKTIQMARERLEDINQLLGVLSETDPNYDHLEVEKEKLQKYLASTTGLNGRLRNENNQFERDRKSVSRAVNRFIEALNELSTPFARYLSNTTHIGTHSTFTPQDGEVWDVRG